jgi:tetratricopeptide (TPR) repeat protein
MTWRFFALLRVQIKWFAALLIVAGLLAMIILPAGIAAWSFNQANAAIARAASLPADSPTRVSLLDDAEKNLRAASPNEVWRTFAQARIYLLRNQPAQAVAVLRSTGDALRDDVVAQFLWANAEWQLANSAAAVQHWQNAGAIEFYQHELIRTRDAHDWQTMVQLARIAIAIAPDNANMHYALGDALASIHPDDAEAMRELQQASDLTRDPELLSTILSRQGEIFAAQKNFSAAFEKFEQAMDVAPRDARPRTDYARVLLHADPLAQDHAEALLQQSIAIAPWDTLAFITLADIAEARGDFAGAENFYRQGLDKNVNHPALLFALGKFYARQNRANEAKQNMILALRFETHADDLQAIAAELNRLNAR